jgi:CcmD family protein
MTFLFALFLIARADLSGVASAKADLSAVALQPAQPPAEPQEEFVPIDQLPPQDQLPAAPLLVTAYGFVWLALGAYIWSVGRRLGRVQREVERLETDLKRTGRTP